MNDISDQSKYRSVVPAALWLPEEVFNQVADIAQIPEEQRVTSSAALEGWLRMTDMLHAWRLREQADVAELAKVEKCAAKLKELLEGLSDSARERLGLYAYYHKKNGDFTPSAASRMSIQDESLFGGTKEGLLLIDGYNKTIEGIRRAAAAREWPKKESHRPSKSLDGFNPNVPVLDYFVVYLYRWAQTCGGRLTVNPHSPEDSGSLIDILKIIAPYLPRGVVSPELFAADKDGKVKGLWRLKRLKKCMW